VTSIPQSGNNLVQGSILGIERSGTGSGIEMLSVRCVAQSLNFIRKDLFLMEVNDKVADFALQTEEDKTVHLKDFAGKPVVLFFYPKADTPGCTIEACGFRDGFKKLQAAGAVVLGISRDTPKAQKKFKEKYDLPYTLLADVDEKICKQFGVLKEKNMYGKKVMGIERTTFLIGPDQKLLKIFPKVKPEGHAEEVLAAVKEHHA
jgi:thioredoxin-dependent peroxiredoxin